MAQADTSGPLHHITNAQLGLHDLILEDAPIVRWLAFLDHLEQGVVLHAGDEIDAGVRPLGEQAVVIVASVIDHDGARGKMHLVSGLDVIHLALGDGAETRQIAIMIKHQMQFDCTFGSAELRPVIQRQAQVDHGGVEAHQLVLEPKFLLAHRLGGNDVEQPVEHLLEQLPRTMAIGV